MNAAGQVAVEEKVGGVRGRKMWRSPPSSLPSFRRRVKRGFRALTEQMQRRGKRKDGGGKRKEGREKEGEKEKESESKDSNRSQATTPNNWRVNLKNDRITEHLCANTHQAPGFRSGVVA